MIYKLVIQNDSVVQGLIIIEINPNHIELPLIETAPHNFGRNKKYMRVSGNLVAFACKASFDLGFDGAVSFTAKTDLIYHYTNSLGAQLLYRNRMGLYSDCAKKLVNSHYKD